MTCTEPSVPGSTLMRQTHVVTASSLVGGPGMHRVEGTCATCKQQVECFWIDRDEDRPGRWSGWMLIT